MAKIRIVLQKQNTLLIIASSDIKRSAMQK